MKNAQFPILILTLSPILGAFITSAHRSLQTEVQIKTSERQLEEAKNKNRSDINLSKAKFTIDMLSSIESKDNRKICNTFRLYSLAYKIKTDFHSEINKEYLSYINECLGYINLCITEMSRLGNGINENGELDFSIAYDIQSYGEHILGKINKIEKLLGLENSKINNYELTNEFLLQISNEIDKKSINNNFPIKSSFVRLQMKIYFILDDIVSIIYNTLIILYPNKEQEKLLPELCILYPLLQKKLRPSPSGDKLAAENQNPPE